MYKLKIIPYVTTENIWTILKFYHMLKQIFGFQYLEKFWWSHLSLPIENIDGFFKKETKEIIEIIDVRDISEQDWKTVGNP